MAANNKYHSAYKKIRNTIDGISDKLSNQFNPHMQCRKGCDLCCMDYSILPVEFHFIQNELIKEEIQIDDTVQNDKKNGCIFLKNHACTIYNHRPVICRTHGLPLLYTNDDYEWELSTCELNFRQFSYENFTPENTFPQDKFNSKLFILNKEFIAEFKEYKYSKFDLVPIKKLVEKL